MGHSLWDPQTQVQIVIPIYDYQATWFLPLYLIYPTTTLEFCQKIWLESLGFVALLTSHHINVIHKTQTVLSMDIQVLNWL